MVETKSNIIFAAECFREWKRRRTKTFEDIDWLSNEVAQGTEPCRLEIIDNQTWPQVKYFLLKNKFMNHQYSLYSCHLKFQEQNEI